MQTLDYLNPMRNLIRIFSKDRTPRQLALGIALGMMVGLVPKGNLIAVVLATLLFGLKINLGMGLTTAFVITVIGPAADRISHGLGAFALKTPWVYQSLQQAFQLPLVPWTSLNNTIVLGSTMLAVLLFYPTYHVSERTATALQPVMRRWRRQPALAVPAADAVRSAGLSSAASPVGAVGVTGDVIHDAGDADLGRAAVRVRSPGQSADERAMQDALLPTVSELLARPAALCHQPAPRSPAPASGPPTPERPHPEPPVRGPAPPVAALRSPTVGSERPLNIASATETVSGTERGVPLLAMPSLAAAPSPSSPTEPPAAASTASAPTPSATRATAPPAGKPAWFKEFALQNSASSLGQAKSSTPQE